MRQATASEQRGDPPLNHSIPIAEAARQAFGSGLVRHQRICNDDRRMTLKDTKGCKVSGSEQQRVALVSLRQSRSHLTGLARLRGGGASDSVCGSRRRRRGFDFGDWLCFSSRACGDGKGPTRPGGQGGLPAQEAKSRVLGKNAGNRHSCLSIKTCVRLCCSGSAA